LNTSLIVAKGQSIYLYTYYADESEVYLAIYA